MHIFLTWQTIITAAAVLGASGAIGAAIVKIVHWIDRQKQQDGEIKALRDTHNNDMDVIKKEQTLLVYGILACLKGLKEQGCNGPVTETISKIEEHLNQKAHQ
jgi:hypothetical protein